jgi:hypothetical protein
MNWETKEMGTVYKYCGKDGLKVLRHLELKVTPKMTCSDIFAFASLH